MDNSKPITPPDFLDEGPPVPNVTLPKEEKNFWEPEQPRNSNNSGEFSNFTPSPEKLIKMNSLDVGKVSEDTISEYNRKERELINLMTQFTKKFENRNFDDRSSVSEISNDSSTSEMSCASVEVLRKCLGLLRRKT